MKYLLILAFLFQSTNSYAGKTTFTAAACRRACESAGGTIGPQICREMCSWFKHPTCTGIWSLCEHLAGHTKTKHLIEACHITYDSLCIGK